MSSSPSASREDTTNLIPSRLHEYHAQRVYDPFILKRWFIGLIAGIMIALGIGLEVALVFSQRNDGFSVPQKNLLQLPPRFLTAFIPTLFIAGLVLIWQGVDQTYKAFQPYVALANDRATATDGLLTNYLAMRIDTALLSSFKFKHWLILASTVMTLVASILQPIAGTVLQVRSIRRILPDNSLTSVRELRLADDVDQLHAFVSAAGFAEAAVFHGLPDPPFVKDGWALAEFEFPAAETLLDGKLSINTTAIRTRVNCAKPASETLRRVEGSTDSFIINGFSQDECPAVATFTPTEAVAFYGIATVENCTLANAIEFRPVMFWYFHFRESDQEPEARSVFCTPVVEAMDVTATADLGNRTILDVKSLGPPIPNDATKNTFNGVKFTPSNNQLITARGSATTTGVSGAVFRFASQAPKNLQDAFDAPNGWLNLTQKIYTQHLAIVAKSIYFSPANSTIPAETSALFQRLIIERIPAHLLSSLLITLAIASIILSILHSRSRRSLHLSSPPGSIAHIIALTAHSGFGRNLYPYDSEEELRTKLGGALYELDSRTGAIRATEEAPYALKRAPPSDTMLLEGYGSRS